LETILRLAMLFLSLFTPTHGREINLVSVILPLVVDGISGTDKLPVNAWDRDISRT
jgi:hypothetical protein